MHSIRKTLLRNANIVCMDAEDTHAQAVLLCGDRIEAVGDEKDLARLAGNNPQIADMDGRVIYPGFIDTHSHLDLLAAWADYPWCGGKKTLAEALEVLQAHAEQAQDAPIVMGYGFDDTACADKRGPTAQELDALFGSRPAILAHISLHAAYVNTAMLKLMGIDPDATSDDIDIICANGKPTGMLTELRAMDAMGKLPPVTPENYLTGLKKAMAAYNAQGFTSCIGGGLGLNKIDAFGTLRALGTLELAGEMTLRCHLPIINTNFLQAYDNGLLSGPGSKYVRPHGLKIVTDGSIQAYTAAMPDGYYARPDVKPDSIYSQEDVDKMIWEAHSRGQQVVAHGNGIGAIERVILAMEKAQAKCPRKEPHHLLIHCQTASDEQLKRMKAVGFEPSFFVLHVWNWGERHKNIFLGPEKAARIDPCGSAVRIGLPFSLHADTPVLPQMTMRSIHTAVTRETSGGEVLGPDQRVSPLEAMRAYTVYAAGMCLDSANRGSIEPGKLADFTILDKDPRAVAPETIKDIQIKGVICGGRPVFGETGLRGE